MTESRQTDSWTMTWECSLADAEFAVRSARYLFENEPYWRFPRQVPRVRLVVEVIHAPETE